MARLRPLLESLEGRYSPAVAAELSAGAVESARVAQLNAGAESTFRFTPPPLGFSAEDASPLGGHVFFSPPALPDPLMSQIGRLPEPSMKFPASGGGDHARISDEVAQLAPFLSPSLVPSPVGEPPDADAIGAEQASPDGGATEVA